MILHNCVKGNNSIRLTFHFSKIFGLIKEAVLANYFGVSGQLDIYILAMLVWLFFVNPVAELVRC